MTGSLIFFFGLLPALHSVSAALPCSSDKECAHALRNGSLCLQGFCTNPYFHHGCIKSHLPGWHKIRVCGSDDPPEAEKNGHCRPSPMDYMEIRALAQDWDSAIFSTWILQIFLVSSAPVSVSYTTVRCRDNSSHLSSWYFRAKFWMSRHQSNRPNLD